MRVTVRLLSLALNDFGSIFAWNQDEVFWHACGWTPGLTRGCNDTCWTNLIERPETDFLRLDIKADTQLVGYTDLAGLDPAAGTAEFGMAIGSSKAWRRGLGREAGRLMLWQGIGRLEPTSIHTPRTSVRWP